MCRACRARGRARASTSSPVTVVDRAVDVACAPCDDDDASATPRSMRSNYDVVVVGAGAAGSEFARTWSDSPATGGRSCVVVARDGAATTARAREIWRRATRWDAETTALGDAFASTIDVVRGDVVHADAVAKTVMIRTALGATRAVGYGTLVIASGGVPRSPTPAVADPRAVDVRFVRDVESVESVARALGDAARGAKRVAVVGNGGVALELVDALCGRGVETGEASSDASSDDDLGELVWLVRHDAIGDAFFDVDAGGFLARALERRRAAASTGAAKTRAFLRAEIPLTRDRGRKRARAGHGTAKTRAGFGAAAGPDWLDDFDRAAGVGGRRRRMRLRVVKNAEIRDATRDETTNVSALTLSDGTTIDVDIVVAAAGVDPRCDWLAESAAPRSKVDGGVLVDECMRTVGAHADSIFAVGDACSMESRSAAPDVPWFQMRLWSQAAQTGAFAARVVAGVADAEAFGFNFELFTHVTTFFGLKVVLLGLYNAQKLEGERDEDVVTYQRETLDGDAPTYVRVLLARGRMRGAVLIGDTDLEETFENLILDRVDLSRFGATLLDPELDLEDYFD